MAAVKRLDQLMLMEVEFIIGISNTKVFEINNAIVAST